MFEKYGQGFILFNVNMVFFGYLELGSDGSLFFYVCNEVVGVFYFFVVGIDGMCGMRCVLGGVVDGVP